ncbi:MAG: OmpH family outer membrane protein [Gemmatimonadetes bacterium]|nr:OmpH family outer membrane protein [Gemmatimonadota bacterium]
MKRLITALALILTVPAAGWGQDKVGYANLDLIIARMPESGTVADSLEAYQGELKKGIDTKQAYLQQKLVEARDAEAAGVVSDQRLAEYEKELRTLDREVRESAAAADQKMLIKRNEMMQPVIEKLQSTIESVAKAEGFTHVFNILDGTGTSVLLWGEDDRDLTNRILSALGISLETPSK